MFLSLSTAIDVSPSTTLPAASPFTLLYIATTTAAPSAPLPVHPIKFSSSPSWLPIFLQGVPFSSTSAPSAIDTIVHAGLGVPCFMKLYFSTYNNKEDLLNWLNHCKQFFRGQRMLTSEWI